MNTAFLAYITNLGKYNEGPLVGEYVSFPTTSEEIKACFQRIGIDGKRYEEFFITDYDCYVSGLHGILGEYENLDCLNYLASLIVEMADYELEKFEAVLEAGDWGSSSTDLINLFYNIEDYSFYPDIQTEDDLYNAPRR